MKTNQDELALESALKSEAILDLSEKNFLIKDRFKVRRLQFETSRTNIFQGQDLKDKQPVLIHVIKNHFFRKNSDLKEWIQAVKRMNALKAKEQAFEILDIDLWKKKLIVVTSAFEGNILFNLMVQKKELPLVFVMRVLINLSQLLITARQSNHSARMVSKEDFFVNREGEIRILKFSPSRLGELSSVQARDEISDIYFIGALLYEMLTHESPFGVERRHADLERAHFLSILKVRQNQTQLPIYEQLADIFLRSTTKSVDKRIGSLDGLMRELRLLLDQSLSIQSQMEEKMEKEQLNNAFDVVHALRGQGEAEPVTSLQPVSRVWQGLEVEEKGRLDFEKGFRILAILVILASFSYKFFF